MSIQHHPDMSPELPMPFIINLFHPAKSTDTGRCTRLSHCFATTQPWLLASQRAAPSWKNVAHRGSSSVFYFRGSLAYARASQVPGGDTTQTPVPRSGHPTFTHLSPWSILVPSCGEDQLGKEWFSIRWSEQLLYPRGKRSWGGG